MHEDRLLLGLELLGEVSQAHFNVERDPTGRQFSLEKNYSVGGQTRIGWILAGRILTYGLVGAVRTNFKTKYDTDTSKHDQTDDQLGVRYGGGIEIPISEQLGLRLEYSHTAYDDFNVDYGADEDSFDPSEDLFSIGIKYRL